MRFKFAKVLFMSIFLLIMGGIALYSCESSEGLKYGTLQKLSIKKFPCTNYVAEFAYEGGRITSNDKSSANSNTQEIGITKEAYDTLQSYLGDKVIFDYIDKTIVVCGQSKQLTTIKRK